MKRIDYIRNMTVEEMAEIIIKKMITDKYCKGTCEESISGEYVCNHEKECAINWLNEEMEEKQC